MWRCWQSSRWWDLQSGDFGSEGGRPISSESCTLLPVIQHYGEEGWRTWSAERLLPLLPGWYKPLCCGRDRYWQSCMASHYGCETPLGSNSVPDTTFGAWSLRPCIIFQIRYMACFCLGLWPLLGLQCHSGAAASLASCANLDEKWSYLSANYLQWCRSNRKQAHVSRITPYLFSYGDTSGAMGNWHKGSLTTNLNLWLVDLLSAGPRDPEGFLMQCCAATRRVNSMFSLLYRAGAFLGEEQCAFVSEQGLQFLSCYSRMALSMFQDNRQWLFPLYPKLHVFHHQMLEIKRSGMTAKMAINPAMFSCQMDEDTIGRASRISRRVSIKLVASRTLQRYLVAAHAAFVKSGIMS